MTFRKIKTEVVLFIIIASLLLGAFLGFLSNESDKLSYKRKYKDIVEKYSESYSVPKELIYATIKVKSNFDKDLISEDEEYGLMQIPKNVYFSLAEKFGETENIELLLDPDTNIRYGAYYIQYLIAKYGSVELSKVALGYSEELLDIWLSNHTYKDGDYKEISSFSLKSFMKKMDKAIDKYYDLY